MIFLETIIFLTFLRMRQNTSDNFVNENNNENDNEWPF